MNNVQIVKNRLKDLKQLSQNLKKSSQLDGGIDHNIIKVIMNITKDVQGPQENSNTVDLKIPHPLHPSVKQQLRIQSKLYQSRDKDTQQLQNIKTNQVTKKAKKMKLQTKQNSQGLVLNQKQWQVKETKLQQENESLKKRITQLQQKNKELQANANQMKEEGIDSQSQVEFKHMSYFRIKQNLPIFVTQISVNAKEYQKIQYQDIQVKLSLDHLKIKTKKTRANLKKSTTQLGLQKIQAKENFIKLDLGDLVHIQYLKNYIMKLRFHDEGSGHQQHLFIKFQSFQSYHRWDIGLFINYKIIKSLGNNELFKANAVFQPCPPVRKPSSVDLIVNEKSINKEQEASLRQKFNIRQLSILNQQQKLRLSQYLQVRQKNRSMARVAHQILTNKKIAFPYQFDANNKTFEYKESQTQVSMSGGGSFSQKQLGQPTKENTLVRKQSRQNALNEKQLILKMHKLSQQSNMIEQVQQQQQELSHNNQQNQILMQKAKEAQKLQQAKQILKKPMFVTKYAEGAWNPHEKQVYLSPDELELRWSDKGEKEFKYVIIQDILQAVLGQIGPGIQKHIDKKMIKNQKCFCVVKLKSIDRKQLQFGMGSSNLMAKFVDSLNILLESLRSSSNKKQIKF